MTMAKTTADNYWGPHAEILECMPRFQSDIKAIRKRLNIPDTGIPFDDRAEWYENLFHNADEDAAIRYGGAYDYELLPPNKELLDELDRLRTEFNLDPRWLHPLFNYIFTAEKSLEPPSQKRAWPSPRMNDVRLPKDQLRVTSLSIKIEKDTTIHDITAIWGDIKKYQAYMDADIQSRRDPIQAETVERYRDIVKLRAKGLKYQDIAEKYSEKFNSAEDVRSFKHKQESRFKKRTSLRNLPSLWWHN
jgi:hypothetical protein